MHFQFFPNFSGNYIIFHSLKTLNLFETEFGTKLQMSYQTIKSEKCSVNSEILSKNVTKQINISGYKAVG